MLAPREATPQQGAGDGSAEAVELTAPDVPQQSPQPEGQLLPSSSPGISRRLPAPRVPVPAAPHRTFCVGFHRSDGSSPLCGSSTGGWRMEMQTSPV